jgi:hypothetical protein
MASLIKRGSTYYAQWHNARRRPSRKRVSLRTEKAVEARQLLNVLNSVYITGEWDPWVDGLDKALRRPEAPVTLREGRPNLESVALPKALPSGRRVIRRHEVDELCEAIRQDYQRRRRLHRVIVQKEISFGSFQ